MVTNYEFISSLVEKNILYAAVRRGIIHVSAMDYKIYYEKYKIEKEKTKDKKQAITNTAEDYNVSEWTIKRAIRFMVAV